MKEEHVFGILKWMVGAIFIGLCIKTGAIMTSFGVSLWVNPQAAADLYPGISLDQIWQFGMLHYMIVVWLIISLSAMKAYLFYLLLKALLKLDLSNPFGISLTPLLQKMSRCALELGIGAFILSEYAKWLMRHSLDFKLESSEKEYLFFAAILFVLARIFKRGSALQTENELTV